MAISSDKKWVETVRMIAKHRPADPNYFIEALKYLRTDDNWERLKETIHGRFIREMDNICPDPALRYQYRTEILKGN